MAPLSRRSVAPLRCRLTKELDIELICANSPQAKGRVERANGILQDRLVKELRLREISDLDSANGFLSEFIADYNQRFSVEPKNPEDSHQRVLLTEEALDCIFSFQEYRKLSKNLELSYQNVIYQIQSDQPGYRLRKANVEVRENLEGVVTLWLHGKSLPYTTITKRQRRTDILSSKEKDHRIDKIVQERRSRYKPTSSHPWKKAGALAIAARQSQVNQKQTTHRI